MIRAEIVADSISPAGVRLTTFSLWYPRYIHGEVMTHRVFSRNASSSRAIPVKKMIDGILDNPVIPVHWGKNQSGMQADEELPLNARNECLKTWLEARDYAVESARKLISLGLHKQIANRILEPWQHMATIITSTEWANFFALRTDRGAAPDIQELARQMYEKMHYRGPKRIEYREWHLPFLRQNELASLDENTALKVSTARCARVSYLNHEGKPTTLEEDLGLYNRLVGQQPLHASPAEHQATPIPSGWSGNFYGWCQHRKLLENECTHTYKDIDR